MTSTTPEAAPPVAGVDRGELALGIEVFARGFAFTKSFTHPYVPERVGSAWIMSDAPRRNPKRYRRDEWTGHGLDAVELDALARQRARGSFALCPIRALDEPDAPLRAAYKSLGYRLGSTEPMMIHRLRRISREKPPGIAVERVTTQAMADRLTEAARSRQLLPEHLAADAPLRQYVAWEGATPVGWVQSIVVRLDDSPASSPGAHMTWCSNMFVQPSHRRRGIARALLARMLRDDRSHGASASVLLASHAGARLYPVVGYDQIGELFAYTPTRR